MKIELNYVSISVAGDYYQVMIEEKEDTGNEDDLDTRYFMIQRQFEMPDGGKIYIETHDYDYIGNFRVSRAELTPNRIFLRLQRNKSQDIEVTFKISKRKYHELIRVLRIMIPDIQVAGTANP